MTITAIADIVRTFGSRRPEAVALDVGARSVTFGELDRRSNQAAQALRAAGVGRGDRVAFI
ncbi:MAG TPA: AMP-binding protein, partial [Acidimicrobiales bacterium]